MATNTLSEAVKALEQAQEALMKADTDHLYDPPVPAPPATDIEVDALTRRLKHLPKDFIDLLRHHNGCRNFFLATDLLGSAAIAHTQLCCEIREGILASGAAPEWFEDAVIIATSESTGDFFLIDRRHEDSFAWWANGQEIERHDNLPTFLQALSVYTVDEANDLANM